VTAGKVISSAMIGAPWEGFHIRKRGASANHSFECLWF